MTAGYASDGLRAWKQAAGVRTYFLYDGNGPVVEMDAAGAATAVNAFGAAGLAARQDGANSTLYTFDPRGSVTQRLGGAGSLLSRHGFDGYGAQVGYYTDRETGLQLLPPPLLRSLPGPLPHPRSDLLS